MSSLIHIDCEINGKLIEAILDSGANISVIELSQTKDLNLKVEKQNLNMSSVHKKSRTFGWAIVRMKIGMVTSLVKLFVLEDTTLKGKVLLGTNVSEGFNLVIDGVNVTQKHFIPIKRERKVTKETLCTKVAKEEKQNDEIDELLKRFHTLFAKKDTDLGKIEIEYCKIPLKEERNIAIRPYRTNIKDQEVIEKQVENLLEMGVIQQSYSPYAFPITLAEKKGEGKTRFCVDYRKLNELVIPDNFPFPRFEDIIDKLRDSQLFTTLDIKNGFWHIPMHPDDRAKTAFVTMNDHFEWNVMPFGFKNSPAIPTRDTNCNQKS